MKNKQIPKIRLDFGFSQIAMALYGESNKPLGDVYAETRKRDREQKITQMAQQMVQLALENNINTVFLEIRGHGPNKETAIQSIKSSGITIRSIRDITRIVHNGARPSKRQDQNTTRHHKSTNSEATGHQD